MSIRVLVVDDERLVRVGLKAILDAAPDIEVVADACDGIDALAAARTAGVVDVALVDVRMPRMDGIETTTRLRMLPDPPAVVVLTSFDLDRHVYDALRAGAFGFLLKDAPEERLIAVVRAGHAGVTLFDPRVMTRMVENFAPRPVRGREAVATLTPREKVLLLELASGAGNVAIARRLHITEATVKTHVSRILAKLSIETRAQAVVYAYEAGIVGHRSPTEPPAPA